MNMQKQYFQVNEHLAQGKVVKPDGLTDMMQSNLRYSIETTVLNLTQIYSKSLIDCLLILNSCPHITIHKPNVSLSAKIEFPNLHSFKCSWNTSWTYIATTSSEHRKPLDKLQQDSHLLCSWLSERSCRHSYTVFLPSGRSAPFTVCWSSGKSTKTSMKNHNFQQSQPSQK